MLRPEGNPVVDKVITELKAHTQNRVAIEGHTCDLGSPEYYVDLSLHRGNSVRLYMIDQGIDGSRIIAEGYGETRPAVPNASEADRKLNQRVERRYIVIEQPIAANASGSLGILLDSCIGSLSSYYTGRESGLMCRLRPQ